MATLKERLDAARAELEKVEASITPEETEEQRDMAALAEVTAKKEAILRDRRDRELAKRLDICKGVSPGVNMASLTVVGFDDAFVVKRNASAHKAFILSQEKREKDPKIDRSASLIIYATNTVIDWNGKPIDSVNVRELQKYLEGNDAMAEAIVSVAIDLSGRVVEGQKR